jgi:hypothetical protein
VSQAAKRLLDAVAGHRSLLQCPQHTGTQLVLLEGHARAITLDDARQCQLRAFIGRDALLAARALAPAAHLLALTDEA